ncbi:MAG: universal stress protein [Thermoleophilia bacterium]|nr:universal stress protein [Gaiellaceae bacterium]MDW8338091.1 universal stress protein [Thermoleophilia bacterium]
MRGPVICGVDGSELAARAVAVGLDLASTFRSDLVLVHVVSDEGERREGELLLADAAVSAQLGTSAERVVRVGDPAVELARLAGERAAALLVVGTRGRGPLASAVLGSVTLGLVEHAPCPVVVVPPR